MRRESSALAFWSSVLRSAVSPRPARLMKYVSIRRPDTGPLGDTLRDASVLAIVAALLVNSPEGGRVESVLTFAIRRLFFRLDIALPDFL